MQNDGNPGLERRAAQRRRARIEAARRFTRTAQANAAAARAAAEDAHRQAEKIVSRANTIAVRAAARIPPR